MKKTLLLVVVVLSFAAWALAQQSPASPSAPASSSQSSPQSPGSMSQPPSSSMPSSSAGQTASPSTSSSQSSSSSANGSFNPADGPVTEGCLGGAAPDFTLTDNSGVAYKLVLPARADPAQLTPHVGESVAVMGTVGGASGANSASSSTPSSAGSTSSTATSTPTGTSASASSGGEHTIQVQKMAKGTGTCPAAKK